ncbi:chemotaxis protein CheW [Microvirga rosea]|uniref:chemotaxis protein CheW n=1 Tax=Microvirga rosea TaxID=2715425 RepID=UPI001D0A4D9B|nr:chemotaxis protein CheW [Microvirga rosea]MCB8819640.1 chemotaxis protein CheW [Microvirga rosea]
MPGLQIILFNVCGVECALRRDAVRGLLPLPHLWRPPSLPRPVAGFFNLGGAAVPVLRLDVLFNLSQETDEHEASLEGRLYRHLILIEGLTADRPTALLVDRVQDVQDIVPSRQSPVQEDGSLNGCVEAEIDLDGKLVHLLSSSRILMAEEQQALAELNREAENRLGAWSVEA